MATAVIADMQSGSRNTLIQWLQRAGVQITSITALSTWYDVVRQQQPDLFFVDASIVLTDITFPQKAHLVQSHTLIMVLCQEADTSSVFKACSESIFDIVTRPLDLARVALTVRNALQVHNEQEGTQNKAEEENAEWDELLPGVSEPMNRLREKAMMVARSTAPVLITGDIGTGKLALAQHLHKVSAQANGKCVTINCGGWPANVLHAMLFGSDKDKTANAPTLTPAIENAINGTLILDNVDALPISLQANLLIVLQHTPGIRIIATATPGMYAALDNNSFSTGLYSLLSTIILHIPSLAERPADVVPLVHRYAEYFSRQWHTPLKTVTPGALQLMQKLPWMYNVRELKNAVERVMLLAENAVTENDVRHYVMYHKLMNTENADGADSMEDALKRMIEKDTTLFEFKNDIERAFILHALNRHKWNIRQASETLGIQRSHLYHKMEQYGIKRPEE